MLLLSNFLPKCSACFIHLYTCLNKHFWFDLTDWIQLLLTSNCECTHREDDSLWVDDTLNRQSVEWVVIFLPHARRLQHVATATVDGEPAVVQLHRPIYIRANTFHTEWLWWPEVSGQLDLETGGGTGGETQTIMEGKPGYWLICSMNTCYIGDVCSHILLLLSTLAHTYSQNTPIHQLPTLERLDIWIVLQQR